MKDKKITIYRLEKIIKSLRRKGKKIVFTNGCFDLIHSGHIHCLDKARSLGDTLIVGLNSDKSIKKIKDKGRPILYEKERIKILSALEMVDYIVLFNNRDPVDIIKKIKPDIHVKGGDYKLEDLKERKIIEKHNGKVVIIPLVKGSSTTDIINRIKNNKKR